MKHLIPSWEETVPQGGHHTLEQAFLRRGADPRKSSRVSLT